MAISVDVPDTGSLSPVVEALRAWQRDDALVQLHPGDLGWAWRLGPAAVASALRIWSDDGHVVAVGLVDGETVLRMTVAPDRWSDDDLARRVLADLSDPDDERFPSGALSVEVPTETRLHELLGTVGWAAGEAWTPLARDLTDAVLDRTSEFRTSEFRTSELRTEVVDRESLADFTAVHRSAWGNQSFTTERWEEMAGGLPFRDGRCLLGRDATGTPVAGVTVWSAGPGRPGLLEPMGVGADHRGTGYGRAICVAAAAALRDLGASTAWVCTPTSLVSAVATYRSAGFVPLPQRMDRVRPV